MCIRDRVEAFPLCIEVETEGPFWCTVTDIGAVVRTDCSISIYVYEAYITRLGIWHNPDVYKRQGKETSRGQTI